MWRSIDGLATGGCNFRCCDRQGDQHRARSNSLRSCIACWGSVGPRIAGRDSWVLQNTGPVLPAVAVGSHRVRHVLHVHHVLRLVRRRVRFLFRLDNLVVDIAAAVGIEGEGSIVVGVLGFGEVGGLHSGEVAGTPVEVQQVELMMHMLEITD